MTTQVRLARNLAFALSYLEPVDPQIFAALRGDSGALASVALPQLAQTVRRMRPFVLVLDDVHVLRSAGAQDVLRTVIEHLPEYGLFVMAGRSQPAMPLARLRADGVLDEVDTRDLALTTGESLKLLEVALPDLPADLATHVAERCEGWAAALYLASIAVRHDPDVKTLAADLDDRRLPPGGGPRARRQRGSLVPRGVVDPGHAHRPALRRRARPR